MSLFPNAWYVARREFGVRARSRTYIISTVLLALLAVGLALLPTIVRAFDTDEPTRIGLHAEAGVDEQRLTAGLQAFFAGAAEGPFGPGEIEVVAVDDPDAAWEADSDEFHGILEVRRDDDELSFAYLTDATPASQVLALVRQAAASLAVDDRLERAGIPPEQRGAVFAPPAFETRGVDVDPTEPAPADDFFGNYMVATALLVIVLLAIMLYGNWVAVSVAEEKSSRVMELLITAASPRQLMIGKVLGTGAAGLAQYAAIGIPAGVVLLLRGPLEDLLFGPDPVSEPIAGGLSIEVLLAYGVFLIGGFLLYITLYAAAGSMVSRQEDVAQVSGPMSFAVMGGYFSTFIAIQSLEATWVSILSLVPFFAPFLMPTRMLMGTVSPLEIAAALIILAVSVALALLVAARIYSAGVLLYGQRRSVREVLRATRVAR